MDLNTALGTLVVIVVLFLFCRYQERKPVGVKPRMLPYRLFQMILIVLFLAVAAHVISLLTGQQVKPRNKFGM